MSTHTYGDWEEIEKGKLTHPGRSVDVADYVAGNRRDVRFVAECLGDEVPEEDRRAVAEGRNDATDEPWTVVTLAAPDQQAMFDDTTGPRWQCVHADDAAHAVRRIRAGGVSAVFVAADVSRVSAAGDIAVTAKAAGHIPVFALVTEWTREVRDGLLAFNDCGIVRVYDLSGTTQEQELVNRLTSPDSVIRMHIEAALLAALSGVPHGTRVFFQALVRAAPRTTDVRQLACELGTSADALSSRFSRAGVPTPRKYLAGVRLLYAAALFSETHAPLPQVAAALGYSSPEYLRQHVRTVMGMSPHRLRSGHALDELIRTYCTELIVAFKPQLARIDLTAVHSPDCLRLVAGRGRRHDRPALQRTGRA